MYYEVYLILTVSVSTTAGKKMTVMVRVLVILMLYGKYIEESIKSIMLSC